MIAVDGPAASGKGTVATRLGRDFGLPVLDTGLLYRAVGVLTERAGENPDDEGAAGAIAALLTADQLPEPDEERRERVAFHQFQRLQQVAELAVPGRDRAG